MKHYEIHVFSELSSTQRQLVSDINAGRATHPVMYLALRQNAGIGSNGRAWLDAQSAAPSSEDAAEEKLPVTALPPHGGLADNCAIIHANSADCAGAKMQREIHATQQNKIPLRSLQPRNIYLSFTAEHAPDINHLNASIYYACLAARVLRAFGSEVFVKWPNDFYLAGKKVGGLITYKSKQANIVGLGLNITAAPEFAGILDVQIAPAEFLLALQQQLLKRPSWREIFASYASEFHKNKDFVLKHKGAELLMKDAKLFYDGSILLDNQRIYGLR